MINNSKHKHRVFQLIIPSLINNLHKPAFFALAYTNAINHFTNSLFIFNYIHIKAKRD